MTFFLNTAAIDTGMFAGLFAALAAFMILFLLIGIGIWIYLSLAFMKIGKKLKQSSPGLAWIPGIGPAIIAFRGAKMHWWPWLLLIGMIIPFVNIVAGILFVIFNYIWLWKTFEAIGKPGWWPLIALIPLVGPIIYLILLGIAAWGE
ncbi:MAG: DUF805 domain-containing protein [Nanoarchaeota archaeon]|nr:DUF805 domain-containing protein [Nanoarchaeota archaeon]